MCGAYLHAAASYVAFQVTDNADASITILGVWIIHLLGLPTQAGRHDERPMDLILHLPSIVKPNALDLHACYESADCLGSPLVAKLLALAHFMRNLEMEET